MSWYNPASWFRSEAKTHREQWYGGDPLTMIVRAEIDGVSITPNYALQLAAWFACLRVRSETVSLLPWRVFEYSGNNDETRIRRRELESILRRPNPEATGSVFWQVMDLHKASAGNAYAEIERSGVGEPVALWIIDPQRVTLKRNDRGQLRYSVYNGGSKQDSIINPEDMLHLRGPSIDGVSGLSVLDLARKSITAGMQGDNLKQALYRNGMFLAGQVVRSSGTGKDLEPSAVKNMMESLRKRFAGAEKGFRLAYLDGGHEIKPLNMSMKDAQFLEQSKASVLEICRWFRMPPHKLCESSDLPYAQREAAENAFANDCITPTARTTEEEVTAKLLPERTSAKLDLRGLLRGDTAARTTYFRERFATGSISPDEIRAIEDEDPLPDGKGSAYYVPVNMAPIGSGGVLMNTQPQGSKQ